MSCFVLEAQKLLDRWKEEGKKEADTLSDQIKVIQTCKNLAFGDLKKMKRSELTIHLHITHEEGIDLPWRVRLQLLSRRAHDLAGDLMEASEKDAPELVEAFTRAVSFWLPHDRVCDDRKITSSNLWAVGSDTARAEARRNEATDDELAAELARLGKD